MSYTGRQYLLSRSVDSSSAPNHLARAFKTTPLQIAIVCETDFLMKADFCFQIMIKFTQGVQIPLRATSRHLTPKSGKSGLALRVIIECDESTQR